MRQFNLILILITVHFLVSCEENAESSLTVKAPTPTQNEGSGDSGGLSNEGGNNSNNSNSESSSESSSSNNLPTASNLNLSTAYEVSVNSNLSGSDQDGDSLTYSISSNASSGVVTITNSTTGAFQYTPNSNFSGVDNFSYVVSDGTGTSSQATVSITVSPFCPQGFVRVSGNPSYSTSDFCISKYEMRDDGNGSITSTSAGMAHLENAANAYSLCSSLSENGYSGTFSLISNDEWMTVATEISELDSNWSGTGFLDGYLNRGWSASGNIYYGEQDPYNNTQNAPNSEESCKYNSSANGCTATGDFKFKRTHNLASGEEIWDLAGNVGEWVDLDATNSVYDGGSYCTGTFFFININVGGCADLPQSTWNPMNGVTSDHYAGRAFQHVNHDGISRGGGSASKTTGIFTFLKATPTGSNAIRCVYRP